MDYARVFAYSFASIYKLYIKKVERKGRTQADLDTVIFWLTGYNKKTMQQQIDRNNDLETFFAQAPQLNPNVSKITGVICGIVSKRSKTSSCKRSVIWISWLMRWQKERQ